jgi:hypothetical protein
LNLYPIVSHGRCKSQSWIWPLWRPYFRKPRFNVYTKMVSWSCAMINQCFLTQLLEFPWNFVPWLVRTSIGAPNLLSTLSKNAHVMPSLLRSDNGTNSNHLEKCSIITKTYQLCQNVKFNGPTKSKFHQYPSTIIGKGCRWSVGALKDA